VRPVLSTPDGLLSTLLSAAKAGARNAVLPDLRHRILRRSHVLPVVRYHVAWAGAIT